jgi:hypothetical protein
MEASQFFALIVGAFFGAFGWLLVGLFLTRRANERTARAAARAVYFELAMNEIDIDVAATHGVFSALRRGAFDRLLPELTAWLQPEDMETVTRAYMSHAGYEQVQRDDKLPGPVKAAVLGRVQSEHAAASDVLRRKAFTEQEAARLTTLARSQTAAATQGGDSSIAARRGVS